MRTGREKGVVYIELNQIERDEIREAKAIYITIKLNQNENFGKSPLY